MKKVLIITYFFNQEVIGSVRLRGLAKYLPKFGWEPIILTTTTNNSHSNYRIIETEYNELLERWKNFFGFNQQKKFPEQIKLSTKKNKKTFIEFLIKIYIEIFAYPDSQKNWCKPAVEAGAKLLENEHFDAIISSSSPVTCHLIANNLKKQYKLPWIADLRDLWTQNPYYDHTYLRRLIDKQLEINTLRIADAITTTTDYSTKDIETIHKSKHVYTIPNGFDPIKLNQNNECLPINDKLTIMYAGTLYNGKRDPEPLFEALAELNSEKKIDLRNLSIDFYGCGEDWLKKDIAKYNLENIVMVHGMVPRDEIIKKQEKTQLLLLLTWNNPKEVGVIPGKLYEYLAAKRPIISIGFPNGLVKGIIDNTNSGVHVSNKERIKDVIYHYYQEFKQNGNIKYNGISEEINKYKHNEMAKKFAIVLNEITNSS